jgi:hypothetical protein
LVAKREAAESAHARRTAERAEEVARLRAEAARLHAEQLADDRDLAALRRQTDRRLKNLDVALGSQAPRRPSNASAPLGWIHQPARRNGTAKKRTLREGAGLQDVTGLRALVIQIMLAAGEQGLSASELADRVLAEAGGVVRKRFLLLEDKAKNASDGLYFARENQERLGVRVEKNGGRWRLMREDASR